MKGLKELISSFTLRTQLENFIHQEERVGAILYPNMQDSNLQQASLWNCKEFAFIITKRHSLLLCDNSKKSLKRQLTGEPFSNSDVQSLQPEDICPGRFPASHLSSPRFYKESQLLPVIILFCLIHHGSIMCG